MMHSLPVVLQSVSALLDFLSRPIYPSLLSVPLIPFLHAARISITYRHLKASAAGQTSLPADLAGFLLMSWGGSIVSSLLLHLPIPQLLSFTPILVYSLTYLALPTIKWLPSLKTLDTCLPLLDALLRTTSIAAGVELCRSHPLPAVSSSLSIQLFVGAVASSGGGVSAQMLRVWEPTWRLSRPTCLENGSLLASTDVWSGALIAAVYGCLTASHPAYAPLVGFGGTEQVHKPILAPIDAKAAAASLLAVIYFWRAYSIHHLIQSPPPPKAKPNSTPKKTKPKKE